MHFPYDVIELGRCKMKKSIFLMAVALGLLIVTAGLIFWRLQTLWP